MGSRQLEAAENTIARQEEKLRDAQKKLEDSEKELADGWEEYEENRQKLADETLTPVRNWRMPGKSWPI